MKFKTVMVAILVAATAVANATETERINKEFKVKTGDNLKLDLEGVKGEVDIEGWDQDVVKLEGDWIGDCELEIDQSSDQVLVYAPCGSTNYNRRDQRRNRINLKVKVPKKFIVDLDSYTETNVSNMDGEVNLGVGNASVDINNVTARADISAANGRINVRNSKLDGGLSNTNGRLTVQSSEVMGDVESTNANMSLDAAPEGLRLASTNGNIRLEEASGTVRAHTTNGNVEVGRLDGDIKARTTNGGVRFEMVGDSDAGDHGIDITTTNGSVEITIPADFDMRFDIHVTASDNNRRRERYEIRSDFDLKIEEKDYRGGESYDVYGEGVIGKGTHVVNISTTNGNVIIKKK